MSDHLTEDERAEVEHELRIMREAETALLHVEPVSIESSIRRVETLERLRGEIARVEALLAPSGGALWTAIDETGEKGQIVASELNASSDEASS
jgi:hypothetical protein